MEPLPNFHQNHKRNVIFISKAELKATIRIGVEGSRGTPRFVHLPPLARLKEMRGHPIYECLKSNTRHSVEYRADEFPEPRLMRVDDIDLTPLWAFMQAKKAVDDQLRASLVSDEALESCVEWFAPYNFGRGINFDIVRRLNHVYCDDEEMRRRDSLNAVTDSCLAMLRTLHDAWFSEMCSAPECCVKASVMCVKCAASLCATPHCATNHARCHCTKKSI
jgi:hypothetical protein